MPAASTGRAPCAWATAYGTWPQRRAAGVGCVGVETGGFSEHELMEAGALHVYHDVGELGAQMRTGPIATLLH